MTAEEVERLPWKRHPKQHAVETLDVGPLRLSVTDSKWWCMGHMKATPCLSRGGAKLKAVLWAHEQVRLMLVGLTPPLVQVDMGPLFGGAA